MTVYRKTEGKTAVATGGKSAAPAVSPRTPTAAPPGSVPQAAAMPVTAKPPTAARPEGPGDGQPPPQAKSATAATSPVPKKGDRLERADRLLMRSLVNRPVTIQTTGQDAKPFAARILVATKYNLLVELADGLQRVVSKVQIVHIDLAETLDAAKWLEMIGGEES